MLLGIAFTQFNVKVPYICKYEHMDVGQHSVLQRAWNSLASIREGKSRPTRYPHHRAPAWQLGVGRTKKFNRGNLKHELMNDKSL